MSRVIEIEPDMANNDNLAFAPLQRNVRGRFLLGRVAEPQAQTKQGVYGNEIPGQVLRLDLDKAEGVVIEPLHEDRHFEAKHKIESLRMKLAPPAERHERVNVGEWLYWIKRIVAAGLARVVKGGELIPKPDAKDEWTPPPRRGATEGGQELQAALREQAEVIRRQNEMLQRQSELVDRLLTAQPGRKQN